MVEYGVAKYVLPGQGESGDHHLVCCNQRGVLIAVIDGIGHGEEAANASKTAGALLKSLADEPIISLVERCHEKLRGTRGIVLSLAFIEPEHGMMTWLGVGNVQETIFPRASPQRKIRKGRPTEFLSSIEVEMTMRLF